jgi:hypothetical protein
LGYGWRKPAQHRTYSRGPTFIRIFNSDFKTRFRPYYFTPQFSPMRLTHKFKVFELGPYMTQVIASQISPNGIFGSDDPLQVHPPYLLPDDSRSPRGIIPAGIIHLIISFTGWFLWVRKRLTFKILAILNQ